jgi:hypothetical protein
MSTEKKTTLRYFIDDHLHQEVSRYCATICFPDLSTAARALYFQGIRCGLRMPADMADPIGEHQMSIYLAAEEYDYLNQLRATHSISSLARTIRIAIRSALAAITEERAQIENARVLAKELSDNPHLGSLLKLLSLVPNNSAS